MLVLFYYDTSFILLWNRQFHYACTQCLINVENITDSATNIIGHKIARLPSYGKYHHFGAKKGTLVHLRHLYLQFICDFKQILHLQCFDFIHNFIFLKHDKFLEKCRWSRKTFMGVFCKPLVYDLFQLGYSHKLKYCINCSLTFYS